MATIKQKWARERNFGLARLSAIRATARNLADIFDSSKGYNDEISSRLREIERHADATLKRIDKTRTYDDFLKQQKGKKE